MNQITLLGRQIVQRLTGISQYAIGVQAQNGSRCCKNFLRHTGKTTRGLLVTDPVILNHGQVTWTTPQLAPLYPNYHTNGRTFQFSTALNVHRCPTRRVFSGTGLELVTRQATIRYLYPSATAATSKTGKQLPKVEMHAEDLWRRPGPTQGCRAIEEEK
ncbi:uncharacterized protein TNCV_2802831 [Trichonephila clavipes]|nr:uncharacterized protein TNCV_2802831 [Trichonephila clavipes]